jgi:hypothetical protein
MSLFNKWCVLAYRGPCIKLIIRPEEYYWVWCVWVWSWSFDNEETLTYWGLLLPRRGTLINFSLNFYFHVTVHRDNTLMWQCIVTIRSCDCAS